MLYEVLELLASSLLSLHSCLLILNHDELVVSYSVMLNLFNLEYSDSSMKILILFSELLNYLCLNFDLSVV